MVKDVPLGAPDFDLKVKDTNDSTDEDSDWQDSADYDEGDTVPFKIDVTLPEDVTEYDEYHLTIEDVMDESLDFDEVTSVQLIDPETGEVIGEVPATVTPDPDGHGFKVEIEWGDPDNPITDDLNGAIVRVNFEATLNQPVTGNPGNMDAARITYSDDPSDPTSTKTSGWDNVITYSYKVEVSKVDDKGKALEGAEFELVKVKASDTSQEVAKVTAEVNGATFTFSGIDDGTYVLRETKAPKGYQKAADVTFVVAADHEAQLDSWWSDEAFAVDGRTDALTSLTGTASDGSVSFKATAADGKLATVVANKPDTPTTPEKPKKPSQKLVKTSDLASPFLPQLTMLGSALISAGAVLSRRKRRNK